MRNNISDLEAIKLHLKNRVKYPLSDKRRERLKRFKTVKYIRENNWKYQLKGTDKIALLVELYNVSKATAWRDINHKDLDTLKIYINKDLQEEKIYKVLDRIYE